MVNKHSLHELVQYKEDIAKQVEAGEAPEEVHELALLADALLKGKVDQAARFKAGLEAHIEDAVKSLEDLRRMLDRTEELMAEAVALSPDKRLEGTTYTLRMQNNSRASVIIEDESKVPRQYLKGSFSVGFPADFESVSFYAGVLLKRMVNLKVDLTEQEKNAANPLYCLDVTDDERQQLAEAIDFTCSKKDIETALKADPSAISFARLERG